MAPSVCLPRSITLQLPPLVSYTTTRVFTSQTLKPPIMPVSNAPLVDTALAYIPVQPSRPRRRQSDDSDYDAKRPYACDKCEKSFARKHDLRRHKKLHEGVM